MKSASVEAKPRRRPPAKGYTKSIGRLPAIDPTKPIPNSPASRPSKPRGPAPAIAKTESKARLSASVEPKPRELTPSRPPKPKAPVSAMEGLKPKGSMSANGRLKPNPSSPANGKGHDQLGIETQPASEVILAIRLLWRRRQSWVKARTGLINQGKAKCRGYCDGDKAAGGQLFEAFMENDETKIAAHEDAHITCKPFLASIFLFDPQINQVERELIRLAKTLPIAAWAETVQGLGVSGTSLAALVGEIGDPRNYRSVSAVWKRCGLAVINGIKQGKQTNVELALIHGYAPKRRSVIWNIGQCLTKQKAKNKYGKVYDDRRTRTAETHPDWTKAHSNNDATRVMTKEFIKDYVLAWRQL